MTPDRWQQIEALYQQARGARDAEDRACWPRRQGVQVFISECGWAASGCGKRRRACAK